jgi:uncharacterized phage protein (TIGR02218 family)
MKTPTNINGNNLAVWLTTATEIRMADLYSITANGVTLRYTTWESNLIVGGNTFLAGPPNFRRAAIEEKIGMDTTTLDLTIEASSSDLISGVPILQRVVLGQFDGATVRIDRLFMDSSGQQIGTVIRFSGFMGALDELGRAHAKFQVESLVNRLQMDLPHMLIQPGCVHTLFDAGCTLNAASFAESNTVQSGSTVNTIISVSAKADSYYDNGRIVFTSGANNGLTKAVRLYASQVFTFNSPLPFSPTASDTFTAYPGCDKTQATCTTKFSNLVNFGGFPYVPVPETAI